MAFKLNKTTTIFSILTVVILLGVLGFLVWRVNQPEPLESTDIEAAEEYCADADFVVNYTGKHVCGSNCVFGETVKSCPTQRTLSVPVPVKGEYTLKGVITRGHCDVNGANCQCQDDEEFYLVINGQQSVTPQDDIVGKGACPVTTILQDLSPKSSTAKTYSLDAKTYTITMKTAAPTCVNKKPSPNSVELAKLCFYAVPACGDKKVNGEESCDPTAEPNGCGVGYKCMDDCTCSAVVTAEPSITKTAILTCSGEDTDNPVAEVAYTVTVGYNDSVTDPITYSLVDTLDQKVLDSNLTPTEISDEGVYSSGKINWSFGGEDGVTTDGPLSMETFTYKVPIDKDNFGTYSNTVALSYTDPVQGPKQLTADATIVVDCDETTPEDPPVVPQTGIFDSTVGRIVVGISLLLIGGIVYNLPNNMLVMGKKENSYKYRGRFEKRVANR